MANFAQAWIDESSQEGHYDLRVLSYNIKGLPKFAGGYRSKTRFKEIGQILLDRKSSGNAPDIVLLQESFIKETSDLRSLASYPYAVKGPNKKDFDIHGNMVSKLLNGGLYVLSRFELKHSQKVVFNKNSCSSWDCFSNKGVLITEAQIDELPFNLKIATTHLQSTRKNDDDRIEQMNVLKTFLKPVLDENQPLIFAGDFNTNPTRESFYYWKNQLDLHNAGESCLDAKNICNIPDSTDRDWILQKSKDQHYYRHGIAPSKDGLTRYQVQIVPLFAERNFSEHVKNKPLSDHLGYEVVYRIFWRKITDSLSKNH